MKPLSIAIPTHDDRLHWYLQTIKNVHDDPRVGEIRIGHDGTSQNTIDKDELVFKAYPKVKLHFSINKEGVFRNKYKTLSVCENESVCLWDSDNIFDVDYLDALERAGDFLENESTIRCPVKALPRFDFSQWENHIILKTTAKLYMDKPAFCVHMNTGNYVVPREAYLRVLKPFFDSGEQSPNCCDVIWQNYHLLSAGLNMIFIPGMQYQHTDHPDSTYRQFHDKEPGLTEVWQGKIKEL